MRFLVEATQLTAGGFMKTCYVSSPFGKREVSGTTSQVDYNQIYRDVIKPAVESTGLKCMRGDELKKTGIIHKSVFSAVLHSDVMIADVGGGNPNVMYELGIRHVTRRGVTILIYPSGTRLPFDISYTLALRYDLVNGELKDADADAFKSAIASAILQGLSGTDNDSPLQEFFPDLHVNIPREPCVFIGHGRNQLWARVQIFLENNLKLKTVSYESEARAGESIVPILESMLSQATFAVLVLTAEDETAEGRKRARQNVIHEAGLFQGVLGFKRAIVLKQDGLEDFSNIAGLQYISFSGDNIVQAFYELQETLKREKLIE